MPCSPRKARILLKGNKAKVVRRTPFTIQLTIATGEAKQPVTLGVDSGYSKIGLSAVTEKKELYSSEVELRKDIVKLISERRQYRNCRRSRKTWYREPRFLNRKKPEGWLAPSIQHKLESHIKLINGIKRILPVSQIILEVAAFDIQKIKNPDINGIEYQNGPQKDFWNTREYVLYRDGHTCQYCEGKSKDPVLETHHIIPHSEGGSDRPDNQITLCSTCHEKVSIGELRLNIKPSNSFRAETFMSSVRWKLINKLRESGNTISHTYGYVTKHNRISQGLRKSHLNDAFTIAGDNGQKRSAVNFYIKQVRKSNRKLFKGKRSYIKNIAPRFIKNFQRYDKVEYTGKECFIYGRRSTGYFDIRMLNGEKLHASVNCKKLRLVECAGTFLWEQRFLSSLKERVSTPEFL